MSGQTYVVQYSLGGLSGATGSASVSAQVFDAGNSLNLLTGASQSSSSNVFAQHQIQFTAGSTSTRLSFTDITSLARTNQLNLDAVSVSAIPEPSTYAAMAGAAMLGFAFWRRHRVLPVAPLAA